MAPRNCLLLLPIVGMVFALAAFLSAYVMAVVRGDVYPWWPYISDTGTKGPERCIFGELLTLVGLFSFLTMTVRYKLVQAFNLQDKSIYRINIASLIVGYTSCFCMTMVANFQETSLRAVHMPSALITFMFGVIYNCLQTAISWKMSPVYNSRRIGIVRLLICILGVVSFAFMYGFGIASEKMGYPWFHNDPEKKLDWNPSDPGWLFHLFSSVSEWMIGISLILFSATFIAEFTKIRVRLEPELLVSHLSEPPAPNMTYEPVSEDA